MEMESVSSPRPISVLDFVRSGRLSDTCLALQLEDSNNNAKPSSSASAPQASAATAARAEPRGHPDKRRKRQTMENAARVALCLVQSFLDFRSQLAPDLSHADDNKTRGKNDNVNDDDALCSLTLLPLAMLDLGDFCMGLKQEQSSHLVLMGSHAGRVNNDLEADADSIAANLMALGGQPHVSPAENEKLVYSAHSTDDSKSDDAANYLSSQHLPSAANTNLTILGIWTGEETVLACLSRAHGSTAHHERHRTFSQLLPSLPKMTPLQALGKLLYGVFSLGLIPPPEYFSPPPPTRSQRDNDDCIADLFTAANEICIHVSEGDNDDDDNGAPAVRSSKSYRRSKTTVFSSLMDSGLFPTSVCRFLSDVIRVGQPHGGSQHAPFLSFEDVLQDLEQMINEPLMFLHDVDGDSHWIARGPGFGEKHFGREREVAKLVKISAAMEASASVLQDGGGTGKSMETVFVSGIAGSGKSHLVRTVMTSLSEGSGWIVIKSKFERGLEHASRGIISSMFDQIIAYLIRMKESGRPTNVAFAKRASKSISGALGDDGLSLLVDFLPSLPTLLGGICRNHNGRNTQQVQRTLGQLIYSLTKILDAILELGKFIMITADDLQWADKTSISLISDLLTANSRYMKGRCLFVGLYRDNEVGDDHPLSLQLSYLQVSSDVNTTEIKIGSFSRNDVVDMIMTQLRLPRRLVLELALVVHKKTSGHVIFVVQLLNSLLRNSNIAYSSQVCRYVWDDDRIDAIQMDEGVAGLILSNFSSLSLSSQEALQILSAFGTQTDTHLLALLENYQTGINSALDSLIDMGILDQAGPLVLFAHDLIQKEIYESMPLAKRQLLHLDIGKLLGKIHLNALTSDNSFFAGKNMTSSTISLACDQINSAEPACVRGKEEKEKYAKWNFLAGEESSCHSDFCSALYYYEKGIEFLPDSGRLVSNEKLRVELHKGAASASYALGEAEKAIHYAEQVINKVSSKDNILFSTLILRSLTTLTKHEECIAKGLGILRLLGFHLPLSPTKETIMDTMKETDSMVSQFSVDKIGKLNKMADDNIAHCVMEILVAFYPSCLLVVSPFLPLAACSIVKFTLEKGVCQESAVGFVMFGQSKIFLQRDYNGAKKCADITRVITEKYKFEVSCYLLLYIYIDPWFDTPRELSRKYLKYSQDMAAIGESHLAMRALANSWRCQIYGGENLTLINQSLGDRTKNIAKNNKCVGKFALLDNILVEEIIGISRSHGNLDDLLAEAKSTKDARLLFRVHLFNIIISYWKGDFSEAEESYKIVSMMGTLSITPCDHLIYFTFFSGLVLFQRHSEEGGHKRLQDGKDMMDRMGTWANISMSVFGNKWLLLNAEYAALANAKFEDAETLYQKSIEAARDHGIIHELGLAYELLGDYYTMYGRETESLVCIKKAHLCYTQWGATAIAKKLLRDRGLDW